MHDRDKWTIESMDNADLDDVNALLEQAELPALTRTRGVTLRLWGAFSGAELVGSAALEIHGSCGLLRSLVVAAPGRRRGMGTALTARVEERARHEGLEALYLLTTTAPDFFMARNYRVVERAGAPLQIQASEEFRSLCPATAICFAKRLAP